MGTTHGRHAPWVIGVALLCTFVVGVRGQQPPATPPLPDIQALGPQVGAKVPEFSLPDQTGTVRTLQSLMGPKGLMLLFYRSADWCPYCKTQLAEFQARLAELTKQGLGVAASATTRCRSSPTCEAPGHHVPAVVGSRFVHHQPLRDFQHNGAGGQQAELWHSLPRHLHAEHAWRGHLALLRAGLPGASTVGSIWRDWAPTSTCRRRPSRRRSSR